MRNETFKLGQTTYQVTLAENIDSRLTHLRKQLIASGKETVVYYAGKVLKSGKVSRKQGGMFYRSITGNFIRVA